MPDRIGLMALLMGCSLLGSLSSLSQQALSSCLVTRVTSCEAGDRAPGILEQESALPDVAAFLLQSKRRLTASTSGNRNPIVVSILLSKRVPASRIHFSIGGVNGVSTLVVTSGRKALTKPLTFGALFTNPAMRDHKQR